MSVCVPLSLCEHTYIYIYIYEGKRKGINLHGEWGKRERPSVFSHHLRLVVLRYTAADAVSLCPMCLPAFLLHFPSIPRRDEKGSSFPSLTLFLFLLLSLQQGFRVWWSLSLCEPFILPHLSLFAPFFSLGSAILAYLYHARWVSSRFSLHFPSILFALLHTRRPGAAWLFLCLNKWQLAAATTAATAAILLLCAMAESCCQFCQA